MSRLRRPLLPVTSSSFTALKHHSRSWRRHAREFEVKPLSFRLKPQPTTTAEATLVGQISLPSLPTQPMSGPTPPISAYLRRLRRAARGGWRQLESPEMQQPDGKRLVVEAIRPPGPVLPSPVGVSLSLPAGLLKGARPVGLQEQGHLRGGCNGRRQQHRRMGGHRRAWVLCLSIDMLSVCTGGTFGIVNRYE